MGLSVVVTGCGPSLSTTDIPKDSLIIGINRSYEEVKPHIICTSDADALSTIRKYRKEPVFYEDLFNKTHEVPTFFQMEASTNVEGFTVKLQVKNSGAFGIWIAALMKPADIYIFGFGGRGHFYGKTEEPDEAIVVDSETIETVEEALQIREDRNRDAVEAALKYVDCLLYR